jgi:hypothetical protein
LTNSVGEGECVTEVAIDKYTSFGIGHEGVKEIHHKGAYIKFTKEGAKEGAIDGVKCFEDVKEEGKTRELTFLGFDHEINKKVGVVTNVSA